MVWEVNCQKCCLRTGEGCSGRLLLFILNLSLLFDATPQIYLWTHTHTHTQKALQKTHPLPPGTPQSSKSKQQAKCSKDSLELHRRGSKKCFQEVWGLPGGWSVTSPNEHAGSGWNTTEWMAKARFLSMIDAVLSYWQNAEVCGKRIWPNRTVLILGISQMTLCSLLCILFTQATFPITCQRGKSFLPALSGVRGKEPGK